MRFGLRMVVPRAIRWGSVGHYDGKNVGSKSPHEVILSPTRWLEFAVIAI